MIRARSGSLILCNRSHASYHPQAPLQAAWPPARCTSPPLRPAGDPPIVRAWPARPSRHDRRALAPTYRFHDVCPASDLAPNGKGPVLHTIFLRVSRAGRRTAVIHRGLGRSDARSLGADLAPPRGRPGGGLARRTDDRWSAFSALVMLTLPTPPVSAMAPGKAHDRHRGRADGWEGRAMTSRSNELQKRGTDQQMWLRPVAVLVGVLLWTALAVAQRTPTGCASGCTPGRLARSAMQIVAERGTVILRGTAGTTRAFQATQDMPWTDTVGDGIAAKLRAAPESK